jgi:hypothetical protein
MADDFTTQVQIGADTGQLEAGMEQAKSTVNDAFEAMKASIQGASDNIAAAMQFQTRQITGALDQMKTRAQSAASETSGWMDRIKDSLGPLGGAFEMLSDHLLGLATAAGALKVIKDSISSTQEWAGEVLRLSQLFGISTEEASALAVGIGELAAESLRSDVTVESLYGIMQAFTSTLTKNEDLLKSWGITTRDNNNEWRNGLDLLQDVIKYINSLDGTVAKNNASFEVFHRRFQDVSVLAGLSAARFEEWRKKANDLGLTIGKDGVVAAQSFSKACEDLHLEWKAFEEFIGGPLISALTKLLDFLNRCAMDMARVQGEAKAAQDIARIETTIPRKWVSQGMTGYYEYEMQPGGLTRPTPPEPARKPGGKDTGTGAETGGGGGRGGGGGGRSAAVEQEETDDREIIAMARELADSKASLAEITVDKTKALALTEVDIEKEKVKQLQAQGEISDEEALKRLTELENRKLAIMETEVRDKEKIELQKLQAEIAAGVTSQVELQKLQDRKREIAAKADAQVEELEKKHQLALLQIQKTTDEEEDEDWDKSLEKMGSSFNNLIGQLTSGNKEVLSAFKSFGDSMVKIFMDAVEQMIMEWLGFESMMAAVKWAFGGIGTAITGFLGFQEGAWNIPQTMPAVLHAGEMVLPAEPAAAFRSAIAGAPSGAAAGAAPSGAAAGAAPAIPAVNFHIHAMDGEDVARVLMNHPDALARALNTMGRGFHPVGR